jgi:hypothetical protein
MKIQAGLIRVLFLKRFIILLIKGYLVRLIIHIVSDMILAHA